jgi:DnaJ-like protein
LDLNYAYVTLNVTEFSTLEEIKSQFRVLAKRHHPDVSKSDPQIFKNVGNAYTFLLKNHQTKSRPKAPIPTKEPPKGAEIFYRKITHPQCIVRLYEDVVQIDALIKMYDVNDSFQFSFIVPKGTKLPTKAGITYDHKGFFMGKFTIQRRFLSIEVLGPK